MEEVNIKKGRRMIARDQNKQMQGKNNKLKRKQIPLHQKE